MIFFIFLLYLLSHYYLAKQVWFYYYRLILIITYKYIYLISLREKCQFISNVLFLKYLWRKLAPE